METKLCLSCEHENPAHNNFCSHCGSKLLGVGDYEARLCVLYGEPMGAIFLLRRGRTTIGHDSGNLIVLGDELISNKHAMITFEDGNYVIEDRHSKNGVFVNGEKIMAREFLTDGSVVKLGSTIFRFEQNIKDTSPETARTEKVSG